MRSRCSGESSSRVIDVGLVSVLPYAIWMLFHFLILRTRSTETGYRLRCPFGRKRSLSENEASRISNSNMVGTPWTTVTCSFDQIESSAWLKTILQHQRCPGRQRHYACVSSEDS